MWLAGRVVELPVDGKTGGKPRITVSSLAREVTGELRLP
jgi:hypothetical protein